MIILQFQYGYISAGEIVINKDVPDGPNSMHFLGEVRLAMTLSRHPLVMEWHCSGRGQPLSPMDVKQFAIECGKLGFGFPVHNGTITQ